MTEFLSKNKPLLRGKGHQSSTLLVDHANNSEEEITSLRLKKKKAPVDVGGMFYHSESDCTLFYYFLMTQPSGNGYTCSAITKLM